MNTRIMAVALVVVGLIGTQSVQAEKLVRIVPLNDVFLDSSWVSTNTTVIVIGRPNDGTVTFGNQCGI
ncbi:MAG: hypothetical protein IID34_08720, partial [Planctomycetes bacterium]|nr:hypothetical protein [Planctomycetota bacterium]